MVYPLYAVSQLLHLLYKLRLCSAVQYRIINGVYQLELSAVTSVGGSVFPLAECFLLRFFIGGENFQAVGFAYLVRSVPKLLQTFFVDLNFLSRFTVHGIDDKMCVAMVGIYMGGNHHLKAFKRLCHFHPDSVYLLRCRTAVRMKGLHVLFEKYAVCFSVAVLGRHKFRIGCFGDTVLTADELVRSSVLSAIQGFLILHNVVQNTAHSGCRLCFFGDCREGCHQSHLPDSSPSSSITLPCCSLIACNSGF